MELRFGTGRKPGSGHTQRICDIRIRLSLPLELESHRPLHSYRGVAGHLRRRQDTSDVYFTTCCTSVSSLNPVVEDYLVANVFVETEQTHLSILKEVLILLISVGQRKSKATHPTARSVLPEGNTRGMIVGEVRVEDLGGLLVESRKSQDNTIRCKS